MSPYPLLTSASISHKSLILRLDLDVPIKNNQVLDTTRLEATLPTLLLCLKHARKTLIIGHRGRPKKTDPSYSLKPVLNTLIDLTKLNIPMLNTLDEIERWGTTTSPVALLENLRFWPGEANNDPEFVQKLAQNQHLFVNDSFGTSHREVGSVVGLPRLLSTLFGHQFDREITALNPIINKPKRPITLILGGAKPDKLKFVDNFINQYDNVLIGGALALQSLKNPKLTIAKLTSDHLDITPDSAQYFSQIISHSSTVIWNGPLGKFEDPDNRKGTQTVAQAIASSPALKIAGGADTESAISLLNLNPRFDHISTGGGAMLHYLAHHTLPALEAIS